MLARLVVHRQVDIQLHMTSFHQESCSRVQDKHNQAQQSCQIPSDLPEAQPYEKSSSTSLGKRYHSEISNVLL